MINHPGVLYMEPCVDCSAHESVLTTVSLGEMKVGFAVECGHCRLATPAYDTKLDACRAWNRAQRAKRQAQPNKEVQYVN